MDTSPAQTAISLALSGKWDEAAVANLEIIKSNPNDTEAMCRLARAYSELGKISEALKIVNKILEIDPANTIAIKTSEKLKMAKKYKLSPQYSAHNESFLEEPGKTKLVELLNLGEPENYLNLDPGEEVKLTPYSYRVTINKIDGKYIGRLPDDLSARLKCLIKEGTKYQTLIKSVRPKEITVFIREIEKNSKNDGVLSFPPEKIEYVSFTPPELVHRDTPDMETTEEITEENNF